MAHRFRTALFIAQSLLFVCVCAKAQAPAPPPENAPAPAPAAEPAPVTPPATPPAEAAASAAQTEAAAAPKATRPARKGDHTLVADAEAGNSPVERPNQTYYFVGARYRGITVPKFMMNIFGDGGETVYVHAFGPEFAIRKNGFEHNFSIWYAAYSVDSMPFKGASDDDDAWELITSEVKVLYLTTDFLWSQEFTPMFALNYGLGAGFGLVFGDLHRVQAYEAANGEYEPCIDRLNPDPDCGTDNDHYGDYAEPSWANGGSKPIVYPWLVFQTGVRFKPHRNFASRLDLGFGTSGFFFGIGADYGI
jgi:hypothetical protein